LGIFLLLFPSLPLSTLPGQLQWLDEPAKSSGLHALPSAIADLGLRVTAVMSDKQSGLLPAVTEVFPQARHAFCQSHYLRNIAIRRSG
jgi:hypothetical protein